MVDAAMLAGYSLIKCLHKNTATGKVDLFQLLSII